MLLLFFYFRDRDSDGFEMDSGSAVPPIDAFVVESIAMREMKEGDWTAKID